MMNSVSDVGMKAFHGQCQNSCHYGVVLLGASVNGLSYVRSLGRRGVPVLCADTYRGIASKSRYGSFVVLDVKTTDAIAGEAAADRLIAALNERGIRPIVFGSADEWQVYIAQLAAADELDFVSLAPDRATIERIVDKQSQYEFAVNVGIDVPPFANAGAVHDGTATWETYPAIVKPRWSHSGRDAIGGKAVLVESPRALADRLDQLTTVAEVGDYLVQAVIDGSDDCLYAYLGCFDAAGREFSHVIKRKLRQHPPSFGDGSYDMTCRGEPIAEAARTLLAALEYRGLVGIEFKKDPTTGEFAMIEINPRTVSTNQLAITAGVDFPWHAYQLAVHGGMQEGVDVPLSERTYRVGVRHVHEEREFRLFLERRRRGEVGFFSWLGEMLRADSYAIWNWRDPWPFVCSFAGGLRRRVSPTAARQDQPCTSDSSPCAGMSVAADSESAQSSPERV